MSPHLQGAWVYRGARDVSAYEQGYRDGTNAERQRWQEMMARFDALRDDEARTS